MQAVSLTRKPRSITSYQQQQFSPRTDYAQSAWSVEQLAWRGLLVSGQNELLLLVITVASEE